ncbi:MAG: LEA type 2 family protein [Bdellovibrionaceae bacterium]|nr:LEA type 2 family protein [Pseudobdellovibrionaceae bacterium]
MAKITLKFNLTKYLIRAHLLREFLILFLIGTSITLSGCETWGVLQSLIEPPKVDVKSVDIGNVGMQGIDLEVNLAVKNPNSTALNIDKFKYDLSIGDSSLFSGVYDKKVELKSKDTTLVMIPVRLDYASAKAAVENYLFKSIRDYKLKGSLSSGSFTVPFDDSGKIEIKK